MVHSEKAKWNLKTYYLDTCNCNWGCPCQFMAPPTFGKCEGISAFHVKKGKYGKVPLDNLNAALISHWPGPIHEGHGKASFYIDRRATDDQFEALSTIITGKVGGPFEIYSMTIKKMVKPRKAVISMVLNGLKSGLKIEDFAQVQLEPIKNPVTGDAHRAIIELPSGFEASRMDQASTKRLRANDGTFKFDYSGRYASFQETSWSGP